MNQITPCLWFDGNAEAAARFHCSIFENARVISPAEPTPEGETEPIVVIWEVNGLRLMGLNGGKSYKLNPAFSLSVDVDGQQEVDRYWNALLADGGEESMCGWLEDRFGVSWQIVPKQLVQLVGDSDPEKAERVRQAMFKMRKIIVADLEAAHDG